MKTKTITVLNMDGVADADGDIFDCDTECVFRRWVPVPVCVGDGKSVNDVVGYANLTREPGRLCAVIEPLDGFEDLIPHLYPTVRGSIIERSGDKVTKVIIYEIVLSSDRNIDRRIDRVGLQ